MSATQWRLNALIGQAGEAFVVAAVPAKGLVAPISPAQAKTYLDPLLVDNLPRPMFVAYVGPEVSAAVGDAAQWNGLALAVRQVVGLRLHGETIAKLILLSQTD